MIAHANTTYVLDLDAPSSPRDDAHAGTRAEPVVVRPFFARGESIDVTDTIIAAIAAEIGQRYGGNAVLNLVEARRLLDDLLRQGGRPE
ncbi:MAG: hypothetical protein JNM94_01705 [Phycisphaerae bacterium]|nr:hypothetical protein [Phycisphaerae bacterium]